MIVHNDPLTEEKGRQAEQRAGEFFASEQKHRTILRFWKTARWSPWDLKGYDYFLEFQEMPGTIFPLQVKSSVGGAAAFREHRRIRGFDAPLIPVLILRPGEPDYLIRLRFLAIRDSCLRKAMGPRGSIQMFSLAAILRTNISQ